MTHHLKMTLASWVCGLIAAASLVLAFIVDTDPARVFWFIAAISWSYAATLAFEGRKL